MDLVWSECEARSLQVVGDVHTHPFGFQQSRVDQANPMIPERGHIAIIVPDFARRQFVPGEIGIFEFKGQRQWLDHSALGPKFFALRGLP